MFDEQRTREDERPTESRMRRYDPLVRRGATERRSRMSSDGSQRSTLISTLRLSF